jgi:hypothetical protein
MEKIKIHTIIEIAGSPREHVEETINKVTKIIKDNKKLEVLKQEIAEIETTEAPSPRNPEEKIEIFSTFADLEISLENFDELMQFCYTFMPSSIEILEPEDLKIKNSHLSNSLNDLLGRLHYQSRIIMEFEALKKQIMKAREQRLNEQKD